MSCKSTITTSTTRWWFQIFFIFTHVWGRWTHFDEYFSKGLVKNHQQDNLDPCGNWGPPSTLQNQDIQGQGAAVLRWICIHMFIIQEFCGWREKNRRERESIQHWIWISGAQVLKDWIYIRRYIFLYHIYRHDIFIYLYFTCGIYS